MSQRTSTWLENWFLDHGFRDEISRNLLGARVYLLAAAGIGLGYVLVYGWFQVFVRVKPSDHLSLLWFFGLISRPLISLILVYFLTKMWQCIHLLDRSDDSLEEHQPVTESEYETIICTLELRANGVNNAGIAIFMFAFLAIFLPLDFGLISLPYGFLTDIFFGALPFIFVMNASRLLSRTIKRYMLPLTSSS